MPEPTVDSFAKIIWNYMLMRHHLEKADLIFVLGSHDIRVALWAAEIYKQGWAPRILFSGNEGVGRDISGFNGVPEAERFTQVAIKEGVPESAILKEIRATNTGQNIQYSAELLKAKDINVNKIIAVQKPYMERRTYATLRAQWPEPQPEFLITSQPISYDDYMKDPLYPKDYVINTIVGDLQRIKEYPKLGFQIEQEIPGEVWAAYEELVGLGYTDHLI